MAVVLIPLNTGQILSAFCLLKAMNRLESPYLHTLKYDNGQTESC